MLTEQLISELRDIAFSPEAKPANRVSACASLARNGIDMNEVNSTLYDIATDYATPDVTKIKAIDLLDKLKVDTKPKELSKSEAKNLELALTEQYVGTT